MAKRITGLTVLLLALLLQAAPAQQDTTSAPGDHGAVPQVWMSIRGISPNGPFGYEAKLSWNLDPGHTAFLRVQAGSSELPNICAVGTLAKDFDEGAVVGWLLEARLLELKATSARLSLRWSRNASPAVSMPSMVMVPVTMFVGNRWPIRRVTAVWMAIVATPAAPVPAGVLRAVPAVAATATATARIRPRCQPSSWSRKCTSPRPSRWRTWRTR